MSRGLLSWALAGLAMCPAIGRAHPITVDAAMLDWLNRIPPQTNVGLVARDLGAVGELIWLDGVGDVRPDLAVPEAGDLTRFGITADATNLYFRIEVVGAPIGSVTPLA